MGLKKAHHSLLDISLETARLRLEPVSMDFLHDIFREFTPEITRYMWPAPPEKPADTELFIRESHEKMRDGKELMMVIVDPSSREFIGCAGLHKVDTLHPELGIWVKKSAHGNGYGREAVTALKEWADAHVAYDYILYPVDRDNIPSRRIPESLGGTVAKEYQKPTASGSMMHTLEYRILPPSV